MGPNNVSDDRVNTPRKLLGLGITSVNRSGTFNITDTDAKFTRYNRFWNRTLVERNHQKKN